MAELSDPPSPLARLQGRTFLITGANAGIGRATVSALAARGASIVLASRSEEKTLPVLESLRRRYPDADLEFLQIDLASLSSVKSAAERFLASPRPLDVLINNAGIYGAQGLSVDGYEIAYATNHLGPFLLTELLLPRLRQASAARVVNLASQAHRGAKRIDWDALSRPTNTMGEALTVYGVTKLMNILHAKELARRLERTRVTTYALHPGVVASDLWRDLPTAVQFVMKVFMISNESGAKTTLYCATAPELRDASGRYYNKCREVSPTALACDEALARELYARSEEAVKSALPAKKTAMAS